MTGCREAPIWDMLSTKTTVPSGPRCFAFLSSSTTAKIAFVCASETVSVSFCSIFVRSRRSNKRSMDGRALLLFLFFPNRFEHAIYGQHTFTRIAPGRVNGNCITRILNWKDRIDLHTYWLLIPKSNNQQAKGWDSDLPSMRICLARKTESPSKIYLEKKGTRVKCARYRLFRRRVWAMNSSYDYKGMGDSEPHVCLSLCPTRLSTWSGRAGSSSVNKCRRNNC